MKYNLHLNKILKSQKKKILFPFALIMLKFFLPAYKGGLSLLKIHPFSTSVVFLLFRVTTDVSHTRKNYVMNECVTNYISACLPIKFVILFSSNLNSSPLSLYGLSKLHREILYAVMV